MDADVRYAETEKRLKKIDDEIAKIERRYKRREEAYDETESLCIQSAELWSEYQEAAARLIRGAATVHTLCANCLEAHINIVAQERLSGAKFAEFDKLSLYGKWLFYPQIMQIGAFNHVCALHTSAWSRLRRGGARLTSLAIPSPEIARRGRFRLYRLPSCSATQAERLVPPQRCRSAQLWCHSVCYRASIA